MKPTDCSKCGMEQKNLEFWITHQTMSDNTIWCVRIAKWN